jgi:hypothetical protein
MIAAPYVSAAFATKKHLLIFSPAAEQSDCGICAAGRTNPF